MTMFGLSMCWYMTIVVCLRFDVRGEYTVDESYSLLRSRINHLEWETSVTKTSIEDRIDRIEMLIKSQLPTHTNVIEVSDGRNEKVDLQQMNQAKETILNAFASEKFFIRNALTEYEEQFTELRKTVNDQMNLMTKSIEASNESWERKNEETKTIEKDLSSHSSRISALDNRLSSLYSSHSSRISAVDNRLSSLYSSHSSRISAVDNRLSSLYNSQSSRISAVDERLSSLYTYMSGQCYREVRPNKYAGNIATTMTGKTCQRWNQQYPHDHSYTDISTFPEDSLFDAKNYCRDPSYSGFTWCYTTDPNERWEPCEVTRCMTEFDTKQCYHFHEDASDYKGHLNVTISGRTCQRWRFQSPNEHEYTDESMFPEGSVNEALNYCRDPGNWGHPWCYTTDPERTWEICDVARCAE